MTIASVNEPISEQISAPIPEPISQQAEILALFESVGNAHHDRDAAAIVAAYAPDAVVFNLAPPLRSQMMTDAAHVKAWLDTWDGPLEREARDFEIVVKDDFAICYGYYRLGGSPKSAGRKVSFWMRATVCVSRSEGKWRIAHEHTSVPFYMDGSLRPAFDLEP